MDRRIRDAIVAGQEIERVAGRSSNSRCFVLKYKLYRYGLYLTKYWSSVVPVFVKGIGRLKHGIDFASGSCSQQY